MIVFNNVSHKFKFSFPTFKVLLYDDSFWQLIFPHQLFIFPHYLEICVIKKTKYPSLFSFILSLLFRFSLSSHFTLQSFFLHFFFILVSMAINKDSTPPPMIGKIGPYTVFMTPPSTPKPAVEQPVFDSPKKIVVPPPPPVQPPPQQFDKSIQSSNDSVTGFFKNAVTKVQNGMWVFMNFLSFCFFLRK